MSASEPKRTFGALSRVVSACSREARPLMPLALFCCTRVRPDSVTRRVTATSPPMPRAGNGWRGWRERCGVFPHPQSKGERFDLQGNYVRRWVPELARVSAQEFQKPCARSTEAVNPASLKLRKSYCSPDFRSSMRTDERSRHIRNLQRTTQQC
ncbi:MAG: FAD-binding domain-containing protein [Hyphomicrobium sp.]